MGLKSTVDAEGVSYNLEAAGAMIAASDWARLAPPEDSHAVAHLLGWLDDARDDAPERAPIVEMDSSRILVRHYAVASLTELEALRLRLPRTAPFSLDIRHEGTLDQPSFQFRYRWRRSGALPLVGESRIGAILKVGTREWRLPDPFFTLVKGMDDFNETPPGDTDARFLAWGRLREHLPEAASSSVQTDGYLDSTRVAYASAFTLDVQSSPDGFVFDPVPLGGVPTRGRDTADSPDDEPEHVVPQAYEKAFRSRFRAFANARSRYVLEDGWYLVFDAPVHEALAIVHSAQQSNREARRVFARNPRSQIQAALAERYGDDVVESLFVETSKFSARVLELGLWEPKVIPWVKRPSETWLPPEILGIQVGDTRIEIPPEDINDLIARVQQAIESGEPSIQWRGSDLPATQTVVSALQRLGGMTKPTEPEEPGGPPAGPQYVLLVDDNLDVLGYEAVRQRRSGATTETTPAFIKTPLKAHQNEALAWLQAHWLSGSPGALLADDMGLGKTLEALAFLAWLREGMEADVITRLPILVVAPTGLLKNWEQEHKSHCCAGGLGEALLRAYGPGLRQLRIAQGKELDAASPVLARDELKAADWVLTTYETLRDYQHSFASVRFASLVFDEAQKIKTPGKLVTQAAKAMNADFTLAMTGTPVENRLADLWCIVDATQPGRLGTLKDFSAYYERNPDIERLRGLKDLLSRPTEGGPPTMLRRTKSGVLAGLPDKTAEVLRQEMPEMQADPYGEAVATANSNTRRGAMLEALHALRSISLHPFHFHQVGNEPPDEVYIAQSARLAQAMAVLKRIAASSEKALVFLESRDMQRYLKLLIERRFGVSPMLINGLVSGPSRQARVDEFQKSGGFDVMILSPRAGGVGLTLTAANHVIHLSRWWNPAVEDQCTDRVYRIGQRRAVHVYLPLAIYGPSPEHSFDVRLHELLERKRELGRELLVPPVNDNADLDTLWAGIFGEGLRESKGSSSKTNAIVRSAARDPNFEQMDPVEFEEWALDRLLKSGYRAERTPRTGDCGADIVVRGIDGCGDAIVQCKHRQDGRSCDGNAVDDLARARDAYGFDTPGMIVLSNAHRFTPAARRKAKGMGATLIGADGLQAWPEQIETIRGAAVNYTL